MTFASIDIGSTAVKFLIASVFENEKGKVEMTKNTFIRIPLRLGTDVFSQGSISEERIGNLIRVLSAFNTIIDFGDVVTYDICATSAMREAKNSKEIVSRVEKETGMKIRVISGDEEASIIRGGVFSLKDEKNQNEMFIDVGGGSTEISISCNGRVMNSHSFPVGTVRLLQNSVHKDTWEELDMWLSDHLKGIENFECIGSGGNISKLVKRFGDPFSQTMSYKELQAAHKELLSLTITERIQKYRLSSDRADVIVPAAEVYLHIMKHINAKQIFAPKFGLVDGLIYQLYQDRKLSI